jgi:ribosomal protein S18 acetylase RimI-like enzyme
MRIRPTTPADLPHLADIDATGESAEYLHIDKTGEGLSLTFKTDLRRLREKRTHRHALDDDQSFAIKQIVEGITEGLALVAEHDGVPVASAAAITDPQSCTLRILDLRVDFDHRRQGLGSALLFQLITHAREQGLRAVMAQSQADDFPALQLLAKLNFEPTGLDTHYRSNHDLVKESVILFFYLTVEQ